MLFPIALSPPTGGVSSTPLVSSLASESLTSEFRVESGPSSRPYGTLISSSVIVDLFGITTPEVAVEGAGALSEALRAREDRPKGFMSALEGRRPLEEGV